MSLLKPVDCEKCGAPLPRDAIGASVATCPFCGATLAGDRRVVWAERYLRAHAAMCDRRAPVVEVASVPYLVEGLLAHGESRDVFLARRAHAVTERVVLKVLRKKDDVALHDRELRALRALQTSTSRGAAHFTQRLPQLVADGVIDDVPASVVRFTSGFVHTLDDVRTARGATLDPRHVVWIWRRVLEVLAWVHDAGWVHGAVLPEHVLVNAREHGALLVGWSSAARTGESAHDPSAESDVASSARAVTSLLDEALIPAPLFALIRKVASDGGTAVSADRELTDVARAVFGPPRFVRLDMPGP